MTVSITWRTNGSMSEQLRRGVGQDLAAHRDDQGRLPVPGAPGRHLGAGIARGGDVEVGP